jgi:hypothetical protein
MNQATVIDPVLTQLTGSIKNAAVSACYESTYDGVASQSGGQGTRTLNRLPGTSFPVRPLAIRLPSGGTFSP